MQSASTSASTPSLTSIGSSASSAQLPISPHSILGGGINGLSPLHCTLFLFDDKLMVVKRQTSSVSGRKVTGLDDVPKLVKSGGGVAILDKNGTKKDKLSFRGIVDVLNVIATDVGNGGMYLIQDNLGNQLRTRFPPVLRKTTNRPRRSMVIASISIIHIRTAAIWHHNGSGIRKEG